jgi:hypothetical protein
MSELLVVPQQFCRQIRWLTILFVFDHCWGVCSAFVVEVKRGCDWGHSSVIATFTQL